MKTEMFLHCSPSLSLSGSMLQFPASSTQEQAFLPPASPSVLLWRSTTLNPGEGGGAASLVWPPAERLAERLAAAKLLSHLHFAGRHLRGHVISSRRIKIELSDWAKEREEYP